MMTADDLKCSLCSGTGYGGACTKCGGTGFCPSSTRRDADGVVRSIDGKWEMKDGKWSEAQKTAKSRPTIGDLWASGRF